MTFIVQYVVYSTKNFKSVYMYILLGLSKQYFDTDAFIIIPFMFYIYLYR